MNLYYKRLPLEFWDNNFKPRNVRDIGGYPADGGGITKWRTFLRAEGLESITEQDAVFLYEYGIRTVIDLRFCSEFEKNNTEYLFNIFTKNKITLVNMPLIDDYDETVKACAGEKEECDTKYIYINSTEQINNAKINIKKTDSSPVADGVILNDEYGEKIHSVDYSNLEFVSTYDPDKTMKADFYMTWDDEYLSMAWKVYSETNWLVEDCNSDGIVNRDDLLNMWRYSCVQFMFCQGEPDINKNNFQTKSWIGNYLETGVALMPDGSNGKIIWSAFESQTIPLTESDITFVGKRNNDDKTTVYEVKIPWSKLGVSNVSEGNKFGFSYAVSAQSDYVNDPHMAEWQDSILGVKNMDAAGIITLSSNK